LLRVANLSALQVALQALIKLFDAMLQVGASHVAIISDLIDPVICEG
jgi:hypothetical protein